MAGNPDHRRRDALNEFLRKRATGEPIDVPPAPPIFSEDWYKALPPDMADVMRRSRPHIEASHERAQQRRNAENQKPDNPNESASEPSLESQKERQEIIDYYKRKGNEMSESHKEAIIATLQSGSEVVGNAVRFAQGAVELIEQAAGLLAQVGAAYSSAAGFANQAYQSSGIAVQLINANGNRETAAQALETARGLVDGIRQDATDLVNLFTEAVDRERMIG